MVIQDLHTHTNYSDGRCTPAQVAALSYQAGLQTIAISDHSYGSIMLGVSEDAFVKLKTEIDNLNAQYEGRMRIMLGVEANLLGNGKCDIPKTITPEVVLLAYHRSVLPKNRFATKALFQALSKRYDIKRNTDELIRTMCENPVNILAHPNEYIRIDIKRLAYAAAKENVFIEINNKHLSLTADDLKTCADCGARFIISSDAHHLHDIGNFERSVAVAREADVLPLVINWRE
ncbi:MAG: PHP domain-containing protein [Clostridiales bacterium]|nr:PHP domain-containing protein [Clostridiales bacterium]